MNTRLILFFAAGAALLAGLGAAAVPLTGRLLDVVLYRYPNSGLVTVDQLHLADLKRGWITREAVYQTNTDLTTALQWYTALIPNANMRFTGDCVIVRQKQAIVHGQVTISVLLCSMPPGTRIHVSEEVYLSP